MDAVAAPNHRRELKLLRLGGNDFTQLSHILDQEVSMWNDRIESAIRVLGRHTDHTEVVRSALLIISSGCVKARNGIGGSGSP